MSNAPTQAPGTQDSADSALPTDPTVIGVDLGVKRLVTAAPADPDPDVSDALVVGGGVERALYDGLGDTLTRLEDLAADTSEATSQTVENYRSLLRQRFSLAASEMVTYAERLEADVIALENITYGRDELAESARQKTEAGEWVLPAFRERLESTLAAEGYQIERVDAAYSTQCCHVCTELAEVRPATIVCTTDGCPVSEVCRDRSAAVTIAQRALGGR